MAGAGKQMFVLWDVDHTLIENSGISKATYALTFKKLTGQAPDCQPSTDGRTDREIMRNLFTANGVEMSDALEAQLGQALNEAGRELTADLLRLGFALPGAIDALACLAAQPVIVQSVLTGNIRPNAENKLRLLGAASGLLDVEVGGYGSDDIVRSRLVKVAQGKAQQKYGVQFDRSSTVLIGDTERDVLAARDGGAKIIAVATGHNSESELQRAGADTVLPNLADTDAVLRALAALTGVALAVPA